MLVLISFFAPLLYSGASRWSPGPPEAHFCRSSHHCELLAAAEAAAESDDWLLSSSGVVLDAEVASASLVLLSALCLSWVLLKVELAPLELVVAALAEGSATEAEEDSDLAAEAALVVDVIVTVALDLAESDAEAKGLVAAAAAEHVLSLALALLVEVDGLSAGDHTTEVRFLAVVALVEGAEGHGEAAEVVVEWVEGVAEALVLLETGDLGLLDSHLHNSHLALHVELKHLADDRDVSVNGHLLLAGRAVKEVESHLGSWLTLVDELGNALSMEDVTLANLDAGSSAEDFHADAALVLLSHLVALAALDLEAGEAVLVVTSDAHALVTAVKLKSAILHSSLV